jgi:hypothetical protein
MAKKKKTYVRIDCSMTPMVETKPPKELRPKCLNCDQTIIMRKSWWGWNTPQEERERKTKYFYDGISYFCCRSCAIAFAHKMAIKILKLEPLNKIQ